MLPLVVVWSRRETLVRFLKPEGTSATGGIGPTTTSQLDGHPRGTLRQCSAHPAAKTASTSAQSGQIRGDRDHILVAQSHGHCRHWRYVDSSAQARLNIKQLTHDVTGG